MTIDERIEALTMNLELVSHQQEADRQRIQELIASGQDLQTKMENLRESVAQQRDNIEELIPLVKDLVRVAGMHERRITRLEGQEPDPAL